MDQPDAAVWRAIHNDIYDSPAEAAAFPDPRTHYDWQQRVIDRYLVLRFVRDNDHWLGQSFSPYWCNPWRPHPKLCIPEQSTSGSRVDPRVAVVMVRHVL